ncbi:MAG TPA: pectate lyase [bacterium]|nr:pectate lyase [bacterium]HQL62594.1 pectate lyase [bacterium]
MRREIFRCPWCLVILIGVGVLPVVLSTSCRTSGRGGIASVPAEALENSPAMQAQLTLERALDAFATLRVHGGWPMAYSEDLTKRWGEYKECDEWQITVQPPATPSVGEVYLRAHQATGERRFLRIAKEAADILREGQLANGGWWYEIRLDAKGPAEYYYLKDRGNHEKADLFCTATLDDRTTQGAIDFLMTMARETTERAYHESARQGLDFLLAAQYPQGGWPQTYPAESTGYQQYLTLNDRAGTDAMRTLLRGYHQYEDSRYLTAVLRAANWLIKAQLPEPHPGWAQQYTLEGEPAAARWFEPPACCSSVTADVIQILIDVYLETGDDRYLKPIPAAIAWLEKSQIEPGVWARFYEIGTNRPIYVNKNREIVYEQVDLRPNYDWTVNYGVSAIENYRKLTELGRNAYLRQRDSMTPDQEKARFESLENQLGGVIASLRADGFWVRDGQISCGEFVHNANLLCEYIELWVKINRKA